LYNRCGRKGFRLAELSKKWRLTLADIVIGSAIKKKNAACKNEFSTRPNEFVLLCEAALRCEAQEGATQRGGEGKADGK